MTSTSHVPSAVVLIVLFAMMHYTWKQENRVSAVALLWGAIASFCAPLVSASPQYEVSTVLHLAALVDLDALDRSDAYLLPPSKVLVMQGGAGFLLVIFCQLLKVRRQYLPHAHSVAAYQVLDAAYQPINAGN